MNIEIFESHIDSIASFVWGYPLVLFIVFSGIVFTFAFNFVQFTNFFSGWKMLFAKDTTEKEASGNKNSISTFQAFINALSASLGNGGLTGMATVLVDGGPGTAFWVFILGFFSTALRFAEVYTGLTISSTKNGVVQRGPLGYISKLPLGTIFVAIYSFFMFIYILAGGIGLQCNSMGSSLQRITGLDFRVIALFFALFVLYVIVGGSKRIMKAAEIIIPIKVLLFFLSVGTVIWYHSDRIVETFHLIMKYAFTWKAVGLGGMVYTLQRSIAIGCSRALNATEAGLGTAGIFFGSTEAKNPKKTSIMSMMSAFISTNLVCAILLFSIILTQVSYDGSVNGIRLVISAYETVFGSFAAPFITFLSFSFGFGVMVAYAFLGFKIWEFFFGKKGFFFYVCLVTAVAFFGTLSSVTLFWKIMDIVAGVLVFTNIIGLLYNLPKVRSFFVK